MPIEHPTGAMAAVSTPISRHWSTRGSPGRGTPEPVEVVLRSGRVLRVSESIDPAVLLRLVAALEQAEPC